MKRSDSMIEEILINVTRREVRVALLSAGILQDVFIERNIHQGIVGNIYKGKVMRLLPGIQAAFIDIGFERAAFLHASDIQSANPDTDIRQLLHPGQTILVQVYKDPLGTKGARLTTQFTLPARYLVFTPGQAQVSISQRISDDSERQRLLSMLSLDQPEGGYIFRTAASIATQAEINADKLFLASVWKEIQVRAPQAKVGEKVYEELPILLRILRDITDRKITRIRVDDSDAVIKMKDFAARYLPWLVPHIEYYSDDRPIFDIHNVEEELQQLLQRKIYLRSGGYIVFDQTEAMTTIDVNTGSYVGQENVEQTAFKINLEAVEIIAKQVRLRNLGGIIIIDFIDMLERAHNTQLLEALKTALAKDPTRTEVSEISTLGLVQMTRKRARESLEHILCVTCPMCQRRGSIKSLETIFYEIMRDLRRTAGNYNWPGFLVQASREVINYLLNEGSDMLAEFEAQFGKRVESQVKSSYTQEQFDILPKESNL